MKKNQIIRTAVQTGLILVLLCFWWNQIHPSKITSSASFDTVSASLLSRLNPDLYPQQPLSTLPRYLNLNPAEFQSIAFYRSDDALRADELCVAEFSSPEAGKVFQQAAEVRQQVQSSIYEGYAPEQAEQVRNALIDVQGNYAIFYVGDSPEALETQFHQALRSSGGQES